MREETYNKLIKEIEKGKDHPGLFLYLGEPCRIVLEEYEQNCTKYALVSVAEYLHEDERYQCPCIRLPLTKVIECELKRLIETNI